MMAAPMGPPGRRLRCDECGRRGHTARSHEPGGILYVAPVPQAGPDLLAELAEVELCEAVSDAGRSCILPTGHAPVELGPGATLNAFADHRSDAGPFWEPGHGPAVRPASSDLAKPEEPQVGTSRELPQSMLMGTLPDIPEPAGELIDFEPVNPRGPDACECCPDLPPGECIDDPAPFDPGPASGADCDCQDDGDFHPPGSGGCVLALGPMVGDPWDDLGVQHGPEAFGPPWSTWAGPHARPRITLPGVYHLTDDEYHDPAVTGAWVSNSDLKAMTVDGCPAQWRYDRDNGVTDDREVYLFGKAVHAEVLGKGSSVVVRPDEWSDWRKAAARAWKAAQLAAGLVPVTPEEAETARAMAAAVHADPVAAEALSRPGRPEVAMFWREQLPSGRWVQRRGMVDYLTDDGDPIDFKTAESANPNERMERAIYEYGYHRQAVTYEAAIVALALSPTYPKMLFLFQQKKAPYLVTPVELDDRAAVVGEGETRAALEVYAECVESGVWPGYGKAIMTIPEYRGREYDEEMT